LHFPVLKEFTVFLEMFIPAGTDYDGSDNRVQIRSSSFS